MENLNEFLEEHDEFTVINDEETNVYILQCEICNKFTTGPLDKRPPSRRTTNSSAGSLSTGLSLSHCDYQKLTEGHCQRWYDMKVKLRKHLSSETHVRAVENRHVIEEQEERSIMVVKN